MSATTVVDPKLAVEPPPEKPPRDTRAALLMVAPAMFLLVAFVIFPFLMAFWLSLHNVRLDAAREPTWVGLEQVPQDPDRPGSAWGLLDQPAQQLRLRAVRGSSPEQFWRSGWPFC